ncbi:MAG: hypothetical protein JRF34_08805, partial [Deltaproteobacteria bacterium]|nr:hypothetical protein [Deltaproteobacteria bacterium]
MLIHSNQKQRATDNGHSFESGASKSVVIIAGEASADLHGSNLVTAMKRLDPGIVFSGIGGKKMEQAGVKILLPSSEKAVVAQTEVFSKLRTIFKASKDI